MGENSILIDFCLPSFEMVFAAPMQQAAHKYKMKSQYTTTIPIETLKYVCKTIDKVAFVSFYILYHFV